MKNNLSIKICLAIASFYLAGLFNTIVGVFINPTQENIARIVHDDKDANPPPKKGKNKYF
jgi:hypothetical protein